MCNGARCVDNVHDKHPQLPFRDAHRRADSINTIYQLRWGKGDGRREPQVQRLRDLQSLSRRCLARLRFRARAMRGVRYTVRAFSISRREPTRASTCRNGCCSLWVCGGETRRENMSSIIVVGHKNPDNDAISAAVGYAYLKNELARRAGEEAVFEPVRLGPLPPRPSGSWASAASSSPPYRVGSRGR